MDDLFMFSSPLIVHHWIVTMFIHIWLQLALMLLETAATSWGFLNHLGNHHFLKSFFEALVQCWVQISQIQSELPSLENNEGTHFEVAWMEIPGPYSISKIFDQGLLEFLRILVAAYANKVLIREDVQHNYLRLCNLTARPVFIIHLTQVLPS